MLKERIRRAQFGDQQTMLDLVEQFMPLLKKYAYKLHTEDALQELTLRFLEIVFCMPLDSLKVDSDYAIISYVNCSVKNAYIALLKKYLKSKSDSLSWDELTEMQQLKISNHSEKQYPEKICFDELLDTCPQLTEKERYVLTMIYYYGYSSAKIAKTLSSSRQNINQIKKRALEKMRTK